MHPTLKQLIEQRGLKPTSSERLLGRNKTRNGYSYVVLFSEVQLYLTFKSKSDVDIIKSLLEVIIVRG